MCHRSHTKLKTPWKWNCLFTQLCPALCNSMDYSPPDSSVRGILQAGILECVAIPFSRGSSWPGDRTQDSCITGRLFTGFPPGTPPPLPHTLVKFLRRIWLVLKLFYHLHGKETTNDTTIFQHLQHLLGLFTFWRQHISNLYVLLKFMCAWKSAHFG